MALGNRQTKTGAWNILVDLEESLENTLLVFLRDTLTGIEYPQRELVALRHIEAYGDGALSGELDGILAMSRCTSLC